MSNVSRLPLKLSQLTDIVNRKLVENNFEEYTEGEIPNTLIRLQEEFDNNPHLTGDYVPEGLSVILSLFQFPNLQGFNKDNEDAKKPFVATYFILEATDWDMSSTSMEEFVKQGMVIVMNHMQNAKRQVDVAND